ncbi:MAG: rod shape-determining protein RodA [Alicyclobacillaceae bacterium]|nr:rod shape-determining protein RodA [Alicyclobacillaceae bacterium]
METIRRNIREFDFTLVGALVGLAVYSCFALLAATYGKTFTSDQVPTHVLTKQLIFEAAGFIALAATAAFDYRSLRKVHWYLYGASLVLLAAVFGMHAVNGAHSWIQLGPLSFQPSEFAKLTLIISVAHYMASVDEQEFPDYGLKQALVIFGLWVPPFVLTLKEPALGQALVMFAIVMTMYVVFTKRVYFVLLTVALFALVIFLAVVALRFPDQAKTALTALVHHGVLQKFQAERIITWLDPNYDPTGAGWAVHQAQVAVGSGEVFGEGLFNGIETRGSWVPNQWTDYIFTAIAEEFGFVASSGLIVLFLLLVYRLVRIAGMVQDPFATYIIVGVVGMFGFQVFQNIGMTMYLSPSTGITLPFISYGGTSLVANYIAVGLAVSAALRRKKLRFH